MQQAVDLQSLAIRQSPLLLTKALLARKIPCLVSEADLMQETGLSSLQLATEMVRLRKFRLIDWSWSKPNNAYFVLEMEGKQ